MANFVTVASPKHPNCHVVAAIALRPQRFTPRKKPDGGRIVPLIDCSKISEMNVGIVNRRDKMASIAKTAAKI